MYINQVHTPLDNVSELEIVAYPVKAEFVSNPTPEYIAHIKNETSSMDVKSVKLLLKQDTLLRFVLGEAQTAREEARTDHLTGLGNRLKLHERYREIISQEHEVELLYIDFDKFKSVNDTYGYNSGDVALIFVADSVNEVLRKGEELFRYGGDEFVVIRDRSIVNDRRNTAIDVANDRRKYDRRGSDDVEKLADRIAQAFLIADGKFKHGIDCGEINDRVISATVGLVRCNKDTRILDAISQASAIVKSKKQGAVN